MLPVLLLHGALGSSSQLQPLKSALQSWGLDVYSMDFSGHSGVPFEMSFGIQAFTDDVLRYLAKEGVTRANVFGYSMGGYVAVWLAYRHPQRVEKIVTLGTKFDWDPDSAKMEAGQVNPEKIEEKIPAFARILEHRHAPNDWKLLLRQTASMMIALGAKPLLTDKELQTIKNEVLILLGDRDAMADREYSERVAAVLANGRFHALPDAPHPLEKTDLEMLAEIVYAEFKLS